MIPAVFVIDTSYLLELFSVPGFSEESAVLEVKKRHEAAIEMTSRLYVPLPCIFELGNHIADVPDGNCRKQRGEALLETVKSSVEINNPWIITPATGIEFFPRLCDALVKKYISQQIGLTDTSIIEEANRLKKKYRKSNLKVHIWTKDTTLKAYEPDTEEVPYTG